MATGRQKLIPVFIGLMALGGVARADLVSLSPLEAAYCPPTQVCVETLPLPPCSSHLPVGLASIVDLYPLPTGFPLTPDAGAGQRRETKPAKIVADRQDSVSLCLYALLSLGLCQSVPLVKKFHVGWIPDWYHAGGPAQIGHSFAAAPDCLRPVPGCCFIRRGLRAADERTLPQHRWGAIVSLWRESQFTLSVLASRGPPCLF
jgi:hypothetical protein